MMRGMELKSTFSGATTVRVAHVERTFIFSFFFVGGHCYSLGGLRGYILFTCNVLLFHVRPRFGVTEPISLGMPTQVSFLSF